MVRASFSKCSGFSLAFAGAVAMANSGGARGSMVSSAVAVCTSGGLSARSASSSCKCGGVKTSKGFGFYL
jgi:hypothetical protein